MRVPEIRDPGAGHGAIPTLIVTRPFGTTPPEESRIVAWTAGLMIASPSTVAGGCVVKTTWVTVGPGLVDSLPLQVKVLNVVKRARGRWSHRLATFAIPCAHSRATWARRRQ